MRRNWLNIGLMVLGATFLLGAQAFADGASADYAGDAIATQATSIKSFLFGPILRVAGILGGAYGLIQAILSSSIRPLLIYGGLGFAANFLPKFIDAVFTGTAG